MSAHLDFWPVRATAFNSTRLISDDDFGPFLSIPGKETFDFTLLFEETILSILPSALLLLLIPLRIWRLWNAPRKITGSYLRTTKIVLLAIFAILQIVNVVDVSQSTLQTRASLAAALLALAAALALCLLSYLEHLRNTRPSSIINAYLLLTLPFDAAQLRTRWLRKENLADCAVATSLLAVKLLVLISEATEKRRLVLPPYSDPSPEATSGLYSRGLFWWLNPLFKLGFRNLVHEDDLYMADTDLLSESVAVRFQRHWKNREKYPKKRTLACVMFRAMLIPLLGSMFPRLILTFFRFMQPLLINSVTKLVSNPDTPSAAGRGWGLTAATGLIYIGLALMTAAYNHKTNRLTTMIRGALVNAIYAQTLDLSITSLDESAAVTLMSSDVEGICHFMVAIHDLWASPIELALAVWLLQRETGLALLGPLLVTAIALSGPSLIGKHMGSAQMGWMQKIQTRIDATSKMLQQMKGVKMLGLVPKTASIIHKLRSDEITTSLRMRKLLTLSITFGNMSDIFAPGAALTVYVIASAINGQMLNVVTAYTTLSLIALLVAPIRALVFTTPQALAALGCFDRIEAFLSQPTKKDHRMLLPTSPSEPSNSARSEITPRGISTISDIELEVIRPQKFDNPQPVTVRVTNLTLAWSEESTPVINDFSFDFRTAELTMIVGPVGCGKSSLLRGLLGETPSSKGNVYMHRSNAAFVDQTPWIQNSTIRDNIIGVSIFEPEWYAKVVNACALEADFDFLPDGDRTKVGSSGAALSGGQKLRVALARAVYSRQQILILDDVFSGLDATSEDRIFSRLLGRNGLLRQLATTVILVTHAAHRLSYADQIIVLSAQGILSEHGKLADLVANDGYVARLAARHTVEVENTIEEQLAPVKEADKDTDRLNSDTDLKRSTGDWTVYNYYLSSFGRKYAIMWMGLMIFYSFLLRFPDLWVKFWTSAVAAHGNSVNGLYLGVMLAIEFVAMASIVGLAAMLLTSMIPRSAKFFHDQLLKAVKSAPLSFFSSTDTGQIVNRFSQDLQVIDLELPVAGLILAHNWCLIIIQAVLICISAAYLSVTIPFVLLAVFILQKFYLRTSRQLRIMDLEAKAPLYSNFLETLNGLVTIRAFGWTKDLERRNMNLLDASQRPFYLLYCIQRWLTLVLDLMVAALAVILVALIMRFRRTADAGLVGVAMLNVMTFNLALAEVVKNWVAIETSLGAISRIKTFVHSTPVEDLLQENQDVSAEWPSDGDIVVTDLTASYSIDQDPVLHNINLSVPVRQRVGICGPSGSGKSSFVVTLLHMLEIRGGSIIIDRADISKIPRSILRERLAVIPQEPIFLRGTISQNLDPLGLARDESVAENALKKVGLWEIISNAGGLNTDLDAEALFSHGQRQLFCLARAMLHSSKILILDEVTASVDLETDRLMQQIIDEHFKDCTILAVAHRLQTIRNYDRIVVFENGRIVEHGKPEVLLANENGKFRALWDS